MRSTREAGRRSCKRYLKYRRVAHPWAERPILRTAGPSPSPLESPRGHRKTRHRARRGALGLLAARARRRLRRRLASGSSARSRPRACPARNRRVCVRPFASRSSTAATQRVPFEPASNEKLTVAVTALDRLGPGFRIPTDVLGDGQPDGRGLARAPGPQGLRRPGADHAKIARLARAVRASGNRKVTGRIIGDESLLRHRARRARLEAVLLQG